MGIVYQQMNGVVRYGNDTSIMLDYLKPTAVSTLDPEMTVSL